jgi:predicted dehydrogenase/threonine dehydrogenase-like Zn-dependent dehydrogenase
MKQVLQSLKTGKTEVADVPVPAVARGRVLIQTSHTLVSAGTERMLIEFGKAGWVQKARQQPDKVRMVFDKLRTDGLLPTIEAVLSKLDQPLALGYCNVGRVGAFGAGVTGLEVGDRVVSNGKHSEVVSVPANLCTKVPDAVSDEEAAFTVLGAIALQGIRLVQPTLGETVVVTGLGLIGLITVQLLRANGCRVLGLDFDRQKLELAAKFGAEVVDLGAGQDPVAAALAFSRGRGVDAVIVTASTSSSEPIHQAALMCRKRGRVVLVGVTGLELSRADFFEKELTFQVSCSYGPGRYDPNYEEKGNDYPVGFVRWTEQRNFEAVLDMMADRRVDVRPLITHRVRIEDAAQAYEIVGGTAPSLGIVLTYPGIAVSSASRTVALPAKAQAVVRPKGSSPPRVSFIGAGNYANSVLMPAFKAAGARLRCVVSNEGVTGLHAARRHGFEETTTDAGRPLADDETAAVVIATRHDSHAELVVRALDAGKHVFVEKPLCLNVDELARIAGAYAAGIERGSGPRILMVGFNRRFSPLVETIKRLLVAVTGPKSFVVTVNAGAIPPGHWTQDAEIGGGRVVGEACHFIDLLRHLAGAPVVGWRRMTMESASRDTVTLSLKFADGSIGAIHYFANGNKSLPKERVEVFAAGGVLQLDNFRRLTGFGWPGFTKTRLWRQGKGQSECAAAFVDAVARNGAAPVDIAELFEVSRLAIEIAGAPD